MEWLERMADSLRYIEDHLALDLDISEVAKVAYSSPFHYQRLFYMITGFTVAEYIRKRRLTLAAQELMVTEDKVIDIALKYGYKTPESFSKAFRKLHGVSPIGARESGVTLKAFPRISFQISIKGEKDMDYRMVEQESFTLVGEGIRVTTKEGENLRRIPQFWEEAMENGLHQRLEELVEEKGPLGLALVGACMEFDEKQEEFTYFIGVAKPKNKDLGGLQQKDIPAANWAVFESVGMLPKAIQQVWSRIYS